MFRHAYVTRLEEQNTSQETMRLLLGHSDYFMLKRYIHKDNQSLRNVSLLINPNTTTTD